MAAKRRKLTKIIRLGLLATLLPIFLSSAEAAPRLVYVKKSTREATILASLKASGLPTLEGKWRHIAASLPARLLLLSVPFLKPEGVHLHLIINIQLGERVLSLRPLFP